MQVNDIQRIILANKIINRFNGNLKGLNIAVWGLAFKPNTDDIREAPALFIIEKLLAAGATVKAFDPEAMPNVQKTLGDRIIYVNEPYEALIEADALAIVTEWSQFRAPGFKIMKQLMRQPHIFDGRNLYDLDQMIEEGFYYESMGRSVIS
jgi:UDPglucose 6-dehydrogenase